VLHIIAACGADLNAEPSYNPEIRNPGSRIANLVGWDGKGKGRQPIENTFVAGETATTISSWAVSANSRHFPRKMATTSLAAPHSTLPTTIHQLPTPNANRPDRESLVRRQAH